MTKTIQPAVRIGVVAASLDIVGGQGIQADALVTHLRAEGVDVSVVPVNPRFPRPLAWIRRVPVLRTIVNELFYLPSLVSLRSADVVHVFSASYWSFLLGPVPAMLMARLFRKRVVLNYHSGEADDHLSRWGVLVHPGLRLAHAIVVPSRYLHDVFARHGYHADVIPNIVDTSAFRYRERKMTGPHLLSTRNLESHYGVDVIVRAYELVKHRYPGATLTVAGYGREEGPLQSLARTRQLRDVRFVGRQEPEEMPGLYDRSEIFLNASVVDNQPVSVLEAFAAGLPVISTSTGDLINMIGHDCGVVVPPADPAAMADAVAALIERPRVATRIARRARRTLDAHTWNHVRAAWHAVYRRPEALARCASTDMYVSESR
jgi:glycosyltransferase involved in cell wall biosynthesis